jgi:integrase
MVCFAAHTGARRSELLRAQVTDLDFEGETVLIHERKRQKGRRTSRRGPMSPFLAGVLAAWLDEHPGGPHLFCHGDQVARSRKRSRTTGHQGMKTRATSLSGRQAPVRLRARPNESPVTKDEATTTFNGHSRGANGRSSGVGMSFGTALSHAPQRRELTNG